MQWFWKGYFGRAQDSRVVELFLINSQSAGDWVDCSEKSRKILFEPRTAQEILKL